MISDTQSIYQRLVEEFSMPTQAMWLWADSEQQSLYVMQQSQRMHAYVISTALNGTGCDQGSYQTPVGVHCIANKIGRQKLSGMIFSARQPTGEIAQVLSDDTDSGLDLITSRILWLKGCEPGLNQGEGVDSYQRHIYIHGTNEEGRLGRAVSHGCIRMANEDVIALFDMVNEGDYIVITGK